MYSSNWGRLWFFTAMLVATIVGLAACAPASQPGQETSKGSQEAQKPADGPIEMGGKLVRTGTVTGPGHNDAQLVATQSGRDFTGPTSNYLIKRDLFNPGYAIIGDTAKSWEMSKDGLVYTFKLHEGIRHHNVPPLNGREFTSEDVKYSLLRIAADPSIVPEKDRPKFARRAEMAIIDKIDTPDKYTVVIKLKEVNAPFLDAIAQPGYHMIPKEVVDQQQGIIKDFTAGTGPFILSEYKQEQIASYKKNPDYWKKDEKGNKLPYLDELVYLKFSDQQAEFAALRSKQLDITGSQSPAKSVWEPVAKSIPNLQVNVADKLSVYQWRFNMNFKPFQEVRVRRAVSLAIDRHQFLELIAEGVGTVAGPANPLFPDVANPTDWLLSQPGYRKDKTQDIADARKLMEEAGYKDGFTIRTLVSTSSGSTESADMATLLGEQLKPLKIAVKVEMEEYGTWVDRSVQANFDLSLMTHTVGSDIDTVLTTHLHTKGGRNYGKYSDAVLDELVDKQRKATSVEERRRLVQEAEKRILEQAPIAFLYARRGVMLVQPWAHNVVQGPVIGDHMVESERLWVDKKR